MSQIFQTIQLGANPTAQDINRIQANIASALNSQTGPFIGGNLIKAVAMKIGQDNVINHGLGRQPVLWVICDLSAASAPSVSGTVSLSPNPYTPSGSVSGSTFTGNPQSFSESFSGTSLSPVIWRTSWNDVSLTLQCGAN